MASARRGITGAQAAAKMGVVGHVESDVPKSIEEYRKLAKGATDEAWRLADKVVLAQAKHDAPRSNVHRVTRSYGKGRGTEDEPQRLYQALYGRVKVKQEQTYAWVSSKYGYINFVIAWYRKHRGQEKSFLVEARDKVMGLVVEILGRKWPK